MTTYRRKPIEVSAIVWTGDNDAEVREFVGAEGWAFVRPPSGAPIASLKRTPSTHFQPVEPTDAIVKDPDGGFRVVSATVFARVYEGVE